MRSAVSFSPDRCDVLQHPHRNIAHLDRSLNSVVHSDAPGQRPNNGDDEADMKSGPDTRNCRGSSEDSNVRRTRLQRSFVLHVSDPAKVVAQKIAASHRTVEAHKMALPKNFDQLIDYCRHYPGFALDVAIEMGLEFDRDRESYAEFLSLQRRLRGQ